MRHEISDTLPHSRTQAYRAQHTPARHSEGRQFSLIVRRARATGNSAFGSVASPARTAVSYSSYAFQRFCPFRAIFQIRMTDRFIVDAL